MPQGAEHFFDIARERYSILLRRQAGEEPPWTDDPVLREFYFCNVFREDDKTTKWLRLVTERIRSKSAPHIIRAVAGFRWFNLISTGERLLPMLLRKGWDEAIARHLLSGCTGKLWSGAYIIMPCPGQDTAKLDGVMECMADLDAVSVANVARTFNTLEATHAELMKYRGMGPFMAYEVVTDLAHTKVLASASDAHTWANPGPGALRGLGWVYGRHHTRSQQGLRECMLHMQELLHLSRPASYHWPEEWPQWDMRTVEHWLCEYDKYRRGQAGQRLKRRYRT